MSVHLSKFRVISVCTIVLTVLMAGWSFAQQTEAAKESAEAMSVPYADAKFQVMLPELGKDSPEIAILRVDPQTQATQLLVRIPHAMHVPAHWHSANESHVIIKGDWTFEHGGKVERLGPGGFSYIPAKMPHQAWSSNGGVVLITVDSKWDVNFVAGGPTKADIGKTPPAR